jgi:multidrug efflux pump subunit AcrA (membrane-fusion protein)
VARLQLSGRRVGILILLAVGLGVGATAVGFNALKRGRGPDVPTAAVSRGDFVEIVETRGDVRPFRSIVVTAPFQAGELQILELAANGAAIKRGDVVANFEAVTLRRTLQDKQSELRPDPTYETVRLKPDTTYNRVSNTAIDHKERP